MILRRATTTIGYAFVMSAGMLCVSAGQGAKSQLYDVRDFGAKGDGVSLDTKAIQSAIDRCSSSGGMVDFPHGTYLTGSLELKSNVEIHIQRGALVLASPNIADYVEHTPVLKSYNNSFLRHSLFYAERQSHIAITGDGTIDGQGRSFKVTTKEKPERYKNRPYIIRFVECIDVTVRDVSLQNSASWMQQYLACELVSIRGIKVTNHANQNNDMMDIDGCRDVVVSDCIGDSDDDGITLKSTSERMTENVAISNCLISSHCNAIKAGTESTGGFRNITITGIVIRPSAVSSVHFGKPGGISGISLEVVDGGIMEGVSISNVTIEGPDVPIFVRLGNRGRKHWEGAPQPAIGVLRDVSISHIVARHTGTTGCSISGIEGHPVEGITLDDIQVQFAGGVGSQPTLEVDELDGQYPEATMWGTLPAYGFFIRHVSNVHLRGLVLKAAREDVRPAFVFNDVKDAEIASLDVGISGKSTGVLTLENVSGLMVTGSVVHGSGKSLFHLVGDRNQNISAIGNNLENLRALCIPNEADRKLVFSSGNRVGRR